MTNVQYLFSHPKLIVGIPCFNEEKYIQETLISLKCQTWKNFIVVISDNASTDKTPIICKEFCLTDNRFYYVCQSKNIGAGNNFTYIYRNSSSPYFMFLGAHDILDSEFLSIHMNVLEGDKECVLSYSDTQWIDEDGKNTNITGGSNLETIKGSPVVKYIKSIVLIDECTAINQVFRREALDGLNLQSVIGGDHIVLSRLIYKGRINKNTQCFYKRRDFKIRATSQMERITGSKEQKANYHDFINAYLQDFYNLRDDYLISKLLGIIIYILLRGRFIGDDIMTRKITFFVKLFLKIK